MTEKRLRQAVRITGRLFRDFAQSLENLAADRDPASEISADLAADYATLQGARCWPAAVRDKFCDALWGIWVERHKGAGRPDSFAILYEPGDYMRARNQALATRND